MCRPFARWWSTLENMQWICPISETLHQDRGHAVVPFTISSASSLTAPWSCLDRGCGTATDSAGSGSRSPTTISPSTSSYTTPSFPLSEWRLSRLGR